MPRSKFALLEKKDDIAILYMNRDERRNAVGLPVINDMIDKLEEIKKDSEIRALIITGKGTAFSSGADLKERREDQAPDHGMRVVARIMRLWRGIIDLDKPSIAAINGWAIGAGLNVAMACDLKVASEKAVLVAGTLNAGIQADFPIAFLRDLIGMNRTLWLALTDEPVDAAEAMKMGLVHKVVPHDNLLPYCEELAHRLAKKPRAAMILTKEWLSRTHPRDLELAFNFCSVRAMGKVEHIEETRLLSKAFEEGKRIQGV